jgi:membrane fusion protein, type I secretion system
MAEAGQGAHGAQASEHFDSPRRLIYAGIGAILLLVVAIAVWASLAPVSGAVIAAGSVKVDMYRRTVQHQEGGIVGEILVRDGSHVEVGDPLIVLKDVKVDASTEMVMTQLDGELAKSARLQAEQAWEDKIHFPDELMKRANDPRIGELIRRESQLFHTRRDAYDTQLALIRSQIRDTEHEIVAREAQINADRAAVRYARDELETNRKLVREGFISQTKILGLERAAADVEARLGEHRADIASARTRAADLQLKAENLRTSMMQDAANQLRDSTAQILDLRERLRPLADATVRQRVVAPIAGTVVGLKVTAVGAVIGPRDPILDIVPDNIELLVEARVRPDDINYVTVGAQADVRLTSFRRRITPTVDGEVIYVSADRIEDKDARTAYYIAHVRVTPEALEKAGDLKLQSGMPAEVFIKTAPRSALTYVVDPILGFLQRSLREPNYVDDRDRWEPKSKSK